ncbi:MAG: hypothetical protein ACRD0W_12545 [Acidimicrobiales bacterium]
MSYTRITVIYEPVRVRVAKNLPCPACGRKLRRQRTFQQTINPFNKNSDGSVKTRMEILSELNAKGLAWQQQPEVHSGCVEASRG